MEINPIAFKFGSIPVYWYGILMAVAVAVGTFLAYKEAEKQGIDPDHIVNIVLIGAPLGWIGARIWYVIFNWSYYGQNPSEIIAIWEGGLAIHGGMLTAILVGYFYSKRYKLNFGLLADVTAPSLILGQAIGRWGNFFNQEAYGYATDLPWAMYIDGAYRHPTFLYEFIWNMSVFAFLLWFRRREYLRTGDVFLSYIALYSVGRFFIEAFRTDSLMIGSLRTAQVTSIALFLVAAALIYLNHKRKENPIEEVQHSKGKKKKSKRKFKN